MFIEILLVLVFTLVFCFIFNQWKGLGDNAWKTRSIVVLFFIKVIVGIFYGWASPLFLNAPDTLYFFGFGKVISNTLPEHPHIFLQLAIFPRPEVISDELFPFKNEVFVWNSLGSLTMARVHAWMNLISGGRYYVNIVFWNVLSTIGLVLLWRGIFPLVKNLKQKLWLKAFLCLNPALLFWASGAHKEGIALFCIGVLLFYISKNIRDWGNSWFTRFLSLLLFLFCASLLFQTRHYYFLMFAIASGVYVIHHYLKQTNGLTFFTLTYTVGAFIIIGLDKIFQLNILHPIIRFRNEFLTVTQGRSDFDIPLIESTWLALIKQLPAAFINPYFRPFPWDIIHFRSFLASVESCIFVILLMFFITKTNWKHQSSSLPLLLIFFGITCMLIIGIVVDNSGAIVRYRSVPYTLLLLGSFMSYSIGKRQTK